MRLVSLLHDASWTPTIPDRTEAFTGSAFRLCRVDGGPPMDAVLLFVARRDAKGLRGGRWRVRNANVADIPARYRRMLTYGRAGAMPWP